MWFMLVMFGVGILLQIFDNVDGHFGAIGWIGSAWFTLAFPIVGIYWIARVVRRAWRDGSPRHDPRLTD